MRSRVVSVALSILFVILIFSLFYTQILNYRKYSALSQNNRIRLIPIEGQRGRIFDRNGVLLVGNRSSFDVVVIPQELENQAETLRYAGEVLKINPQAMLERIKRKYIAPFAPVVIKEDITKKEAIALEEGSLSLPGIMVRVVPRREYKFKETGSHIFGYLGEIGRDELGRLKTYGYQMRDLVGKSGLEKNYDNYLRGEEGGMQLEVNNRGYFMRPLGKKEAKCGKDLFLTIDIRLQEFIENLFGDKTGACVVIAPYTGEILALVSEPNFDPAVFINSQGHKERAVFLTGPKRPMLNRAITGLYPPGSVFKPVVGVAGLEKKRITPQSTLTCNGKYIVGGKEFKCWDEDGHGTENITEGLKNSCNVFFYQLGRLVGVDDISAFASKFGYGVPTGIDLPEEAGGLVPNRLWKRLARNEAWFEGDTVNFSIGQGYLLVTPLQVARMMAGIANGGVLVQPYIVKKIDNVEVSAGGTRDIGVSKRTLDVIREGLKKVVQDENGTGRRARVEGLIIAGKTGTAQAHGELTHAWFTGFSPVEDSKIALVVFVEHGGKGGLNAAEFAGKIFEEAKKIGLL